MYRAKTNHAIARTTMRSLAIVFIVQILQVIVGGTCPPNSTRGEEKTDPNVLLQEPIAQHALCISRSCANEIACHISKITGPRQFTISCNGVDKTRRLSVLDVICKEVPNPESPTDPCFANHTCSIVYRLHWIVPLYLIIFAGILLSAVLMAYLWWQKGSAEVPPRPEPPKPRNTARVTNLPRPSSEPKSLLSSKPASIKHSIVSILFRDPQLSTQPLKIDSSKIMDSDSFLRSAGNVESETGKRSSISNLDTLDLSRRTEIARTKD